MSENIMDKANEFLAQAEEAFNRLGISENIEALLESKQIVYTIDRAYDACVAVLQDMTRKAPETMAEVAENNLKAFQEGKENFISDFKANFKRVVGVPLFYHLQMSGDEEKMKNSILPNIQSAESVEVKIVAKQIVDRMVIDITKDYLLSTYGNIIPANVLNPDA